MVNLVVFEASAYLSYWAEDKDPLHYPFEIKKILFGNNDDIVIFFTFL
jgi:hypothetical protein